ncbi:MAG: glycosyltransferase family 4 protein [Fibrobacterota bacterium]
MTRPCRIMISNEFLDLHRGEKDFVLGKALSKRPGTETHFLHSGNVSIPDEDAGFKPGSSTWRERLQGTTAAVSTYQALRLVRRTHNKSVAYLLPNPVSYLAALRRIRPDWIIDTVYTTLTPRSFLNGLYCKLSGAGMIVLDAGDDAKNKRLLPFEHSVIRAVKAVFTYNPASATRIRNKYSLDAAHPVIVHHKMLDTADFPFDPSRVGARPRVGYVGRFVAAKGFDRFLEYSSRMSHLAEFVAVGHNEEDFSIPDSVRVVPSVPNKELHRVYSQIDILVIPDLGRFRSYATVVQEALLCGCRVWIGNLSPDYFPVPHLVDFFQPDDTSGLEAELARLAGLDLASRIGERQEVADCSRAIFDPGIVVDRVVSVLEGIVK